MASPIIVADFNTNLSTAISVGATTFSIASNLDADGNAIPGGTYYFTIDNGSSSKEYLTGTLSGTSVTAVKSVSRQAVETSGAVRAHRVGAAVILTDFATYKKYIDAIALAGTTLATASVAGVSRLSVTAANGSDPIVVGDNDPRIPTSNGVQFMNGVTGMVIPYAGSAAPTGFLLCDGGEVSRSTYAALFAVIGTTYGAGNGSTTFNVPDGRGRSVIGAGTGTKVATVASVAGNVLTVTGLTNAINEFQTGQAVVFTASVAGNLFNAATYYVVRVSNSTVSLATTLANAQNGTVLTLAGTERGTLTLTLSTRTRGDTGGEESHSQSAAELANHSHTINSASSSAGSGAYMLSQAGITTTPVSINTTGSNAAMNTMSPFFVANWIIKT